MSLTSVLATLWQYLLYRRKLQFFALLALMLIGAAFEVVSLGMVIPFIGVLTQPEALFSSAFFGEVFKNIGFVETEQLILPMTLIFILGAVCAGGVRFAVLWASARLSNAVGVDFGVDVYRRTLYQPYRVHINRNSSEVISGITLKTGAVIGAVLLQVLVFISAAIVSVFIFGLLVVVQPAVAMAAFAILGGFYLLVTLIVRKILENNGAIIAKEQTRIVRAVQEGLGGIRDILLDSTQPIYINNFRRSEYSLRRAVGSNTIYSSSPRIALETLIMVLIGLGAYFFSKSHGSFSESLPVLGALALGAQRLIPMLQQCYSAWTRITGFLPALADSLKLLDQPLEPDFYENKAVKLPFQSELIFDRVSFRYSDTLPYVFTNVSFTIKRGNRVGIVGETGSGKSTLTDLILGLITPTEGHILIDGEKLSPSNVKAWQCNLAHVPQNVFLSDASILENIAFGVPRQQIDLDRVRKVAEQAKLNELIKDLPDGWQTKVGERGIRLSGGQCQRIGIARALYKGASLLVFDEATSALDSATEEAIMEAINALDKELTILIIAHRLSTLEGCDFILHVSKGEVKRLNGVDSLESSGNDIGLAMSAQ